MKLHCHRPSLAAAFQVVSGIIPSRTPKEILKNVKLEVADGKAVLIGTDSEVGIRYEIPGVEIESGGEMLLPANRVSTILRELTDDGVNIEVKEDTVLIRAGHSEFRLSAVDPAEYPPVASFDQDRYHMISGNAFREAIRRTVFAADVESTRYALGGVLLDFQSDSLVLAATDSRRLAVMKTACRSQGVEELQNTAPVVPSKAMSLIERSIAEGDDDVLVAIGANEVLVKSSNSTVSSRLVEGRFPKYNDVIPKESKVTVELIAGPFFSAVRQAQIVTNEESRGVDFIFSDGLLTLDSKASDIGQSKVELPIAYEAEKLAITFDPRFVAEFLRVIEPERQIRIELTDAESAAVLRSDDNYTYVIMPLSRDR